MRSEWNCILVQKHNEARDKLVCCLTFYNCNIFYLQLDLELTTRHELQVEIRKKETDFESKLSELQTKLQMLETDKTEVVTDNKKLLNEINQLKDEVIHLI